MHPFADFHEALRVAFVSLLMELQYIVNGRDTDETRCIDRRGLGNELGERLQRRSIDKLKHGFFSTELCIELASGM